MPLFLYADKLLAGSCKRSKFWTNSWELIFFCQVVWFKIRLSDGISQRLPCLDLKWNAVWILLPVIFFRKKIIPWNPKTQPVILKTKQWKVLLKQAWTNKINIFSFAIAMGPESRRKHWAGYWIIWSSFQSDLLYFPIFAELLHWTVAPYQKYWKRIQNILWSGVFPGLWGFCLNRPDQVTGITWL